MKQGKTIIILKETYTLCALLIRHDNNSLSSFVMAFDRQFLFLHSCGYRLKFRVNPRNVEEKHRVSFCHVTSIIVNHFTKS